MITRRPMRSAFIVLWIALQVAIPLSYYAGDDVFDERFAWRMFSPVRVVSCQTRFIDATDGLQTTVRAAADVHEVWGSLLTRARRDVIAGYARKWCDERRAAGAGRPVLRVDVVCTNPEALNRPMCKGALVDADADGVPDAYREATACAGMRPIECYRADCGDARPSDCRAHLCQVRPVPEMLNLCEDDLG
jgi:hypothetical protein